jgi:hypothetical protein
VALSIYRRERSILLSEATPFTHCRQCAQFRLTRGWINPDRFQFGSPRVFLRPHCCKRRI